MERMTLLPKGCVLWFTGLPCSGKTTLSDAVEKVLSGGGYPVEHLDGDTVRQDLSRDLGYSPEDRAKNVERVAFLAARLAHNGILTLVSLISPSRAGRDKARRQIGCFVEIHVDCPLAVCEKRDVKGMYRLARQGKIRDFTGVSAPYEVPPAPELRLDTERLGVDACVEKVLDFLEREELILPRKKSGSFPKVSRPQERFPQLLHQAVAA
jgi:adenylyl-sulfate kinase